MIDEELHNLLVRTKEALAEARISRYSYTTELVEVEIAIEEYLDMEEALFVGYEHVSDIFDRCED